MPNRKGPGTHLGYLTPPPGKHTKQYANELRIVYGACRMKNPGESPAAKSKCAKIAHTVAKAKYGR